MTHESYTRQSAFGTHCTCCGSLVDACGDVVQCRIDAKLHIDKAIHTGRPLTSYGDTEATMVADLADLASRMLGDFLFPGPDSP